MSRPSLRAAAVAAAAALCLAGAVAPASATMPTSERGSTCFDPHDVGAGARGAGHVRGADHRDISVAEQRAVARRTARILAAKGGRPGAGGSTTSSGAEVPVYVHVMRDDAGNGDVTAQQVADQIAVLNKTYAGDESSAAADTGFTFRLAGIDRFDNTTWHNDRSSSKYRSQTRQGGANALNIWLVDFKYLGIATFPWDYARNGAIDGIRVHYASLPGGDIENYNLGETATHEAGHWLGLYHTFQGGCTETNDQVADTPAQSSPTTACPEGRDSCALPGLDPIHNYMDYSYDSCYNQFTADQTTRMQSMWTAYRG
ncbi:MAG TPA: zinc metalloprotease [Nocardioidaceae bacterium]|nr:zinc metalloprotease [Nocardioidaceae bacterium]